MICNPLATRICTGWVPSFLASLLAAPGYCHGCFNGELRFPPDNNSSTPLSLRTPSPSLYNHHRHHCCYYLHKISSLASTTVLNFPHCHIRPRSQKQSPAPQQIALPSRSPPTPCRHCSRLPPKTSHRYTFLLLPFSPLLVQLCAWCWLLLTL
ncbi:hypothetical protein E2C01_043175 [Portunus trituberculatus]|uniref:Uncharacterized protein n=1 Tax=Portunus trituberculatus TaxID=210409 RepID=A0A5B7FUZ9_PORTR|nr:hypothetical protein [Portunus trituberculatus]